MTQQQALDIMKMGHNVFLTGGAGSGKTYVLNKYIDYLRDHEIPVAVTASTGIAATHIHGMTIHAWSGIGVRDTLNEYDLDSMETKKYLYDRFQKARVLIIDEISMLSGNYFQNVERVCRHMKRNPAPFGGLQVIVCGDLFQLPPVSKGNQNDVMMAPDTTAWQHMKPVVCYLSEQHRQEDDDFTVILNAIRASSVTANHCDTLLDRIIQGDNYDGIDTDWDDDTIRYDTHIIHNDDEEFLVDTTVLPITKLYTHNADVDRVNESIFQKLDGKTHTYSMTAKGKENLVTGLQKNCLAPMTLYLKIGTEVMFVKNNFESGYVNGTRGTVIKFDKTTGNPVVRTVHGDIITVEPVEWSIQTDDGKILASINQLPLRHAWAITVHKSQGMSLDGAHIDLSRSFTYGMGYVALSRVRKLSGLQLSPITEEQLQQALLVDPRIAVMDIKLHKQSDMAVERLVRLDEQSITKIHHDFIIQSGGVITVDTTKEKNTKTKGIKNAKNTIIETIDVFRSGLSLAQTAENRGLKLETIIDHMEKQILSKSEKERIIDEIYGNYNNIDDKVFKKIKKAFKELGYEKLSPVKKQLDEQGIDISYLVLRLARLVLQ